MHQSTTIQLQVVQGGFIMSTYDGHVEKTEVFTSQGKLLKAIRAVIEANSPDGEERPKEEDLNT